MGGRVVVLRCCFSLLIVFCSVCLRGLFWFINWGLLCLFVGFDLVYQLGFLRLAAL